MKLSLWDKLTGKTVPPVFKFASEEFVVAFRKQAGDSEKAEVNEMLGQLEQSFLEKVSHVEKSTAVGTNP